MNTKNEGQTVGTAARGLDGLVLKCGGHKSPDDGLCIMEAVAWYYGEKHSAWPACASRVIGASLQVLNDTMTDKERQQLIPLIPRIAGTGRDWDMEVKRAFFLVDTFVRKTLPMFWDAFGLVAEAAGLKGFEVIKDESSAARSANELSSIFENSKKLRDLSALSDLSDLSALSALSDLSALSALLANPQAIAALRAKQMAIALEAITAAIDIT